MRSRLILALAVCGASVLPASAEPVEAFYRGRTVTVLIGYSIGGGYDSYARGLARHIAKHLPGNPTVIAQNLPGAGSLKLANNLYNVAPRDGSTFGAFGRGLAMEPLLGDKNVAFDARRFTWLGSIANEVSVCTSWQTSPVKSWGDMLTHEFTVGGEGSGSDPDIFAMMLKSLFGAKIKRVTGYPGSPEMSLAMERGEIDGRCGWSLSSIAAQKPEWLTEGKIRILVQLGLARSPDLPDVPLVTDFATSERQRQILRLVLSRQVMGRPFAAPPDLPEDRRRALRDAFDQTMKDPEFLADAAKAGLEVNPVAGAELDRLIGELYATPPDVVEEARAAIAAAR